MQELLARPFLFSLVLYVLAFLLTTVLHELGHACASVALGGRPVLHHVSVEHEGREGARQAAVSAAGPLLSLVQGLALLGALQWMPPAATATRLFVLWACIHGLVNFFGYLITTPFVANADLGKVAAWLGLPLAGKFALMAVGLAAVTVIGMWAREPMLAFFTDPAAVADPVARARHIVQIGVLVWLVGSVVIALVSWPSPHWISYVYPFFAGFFLIVTWRRIDAIAPPMLPDTLWAAGPLWPWALGLLALIAVFRGVLLPGVRFAG